MCRHCQSDGMGDTRRCKDRPFSTPPPPPATRPPPGAHGCEPRNPLGFESLVGSGGGEGTRVTHLSTAAVSISVEGYPRLGLLHNIMLSPMTYDYPFGPSVTGSPAASEPRGRKKSRLANKHTQQHPYISYTTQEERTKQQNTS
jgi:hypothetical protein